MLQPDALPRTPPAAVRRELRQEVGFRCPVDDCGLPYLTWHHFDPPWRDEKHHRASGMIALCSVHAAQADGGAWTTDQLLMMKASGRRRSEAIQGRFEWLRRDLLVAAGTNLFFKNETVFQIGDRKCIWVGRDEREYATLSFWLPTATQESRAYIIDNGWVVPPNVADMECPPSGRRLSVWYGNGDRFTAEFFEFDTRTGLEAKFPGFDLSDLPVPLTAVELAETAAGSSWEFGPYHTRIENSVIRNGFFRGGVGIKLELPPGLRAPAADDEESHVPRVSLPFPKHGPGKRRRRARR